MAIISAREVLDVFIMTAAVGYIFMGLFKQQLSQELTTKFSWRIFLFSSLLAAPALILHEMAHKFTALAFGLQAVFHAAYTWLGIGILLTVLKTGFIFFVPGYVQISTGTSPIQHGIIAFAGPFLNLLLFITAWAVLRYKQDLKKNHYLFWYITKQLNLLLFVFNMLPIPLFDGWKVYAGFWNFFFA